MASKMRSPCGLCLALSVMCATNAAQAQCPPQWAGGFAQPGLDGTAYVTAVFDDNTGDGRTLYVGGNFTIAGNTAAASIARWTGTSWSPLGLGISGASSTVYALTVFDDGLGGPPQLYVGGSFTMAGVVSANNLARWDGTTWSAVGGGLNGTVRALALYDDGSGPALYVGGSFSLAGGTVITSNIARWNGASWSALASGVSGGSVGALAVYDDGTGPGLYAGGTFTGASGAVNRIARWNGSSWSALGSGIGGSTIGATSVNALTVYDDGTGPGLYAAGNFGVAGGVDSPRIARWNGQSWSGCGGGVYGGFFDTIHADALCVFNDGTGSKLYVGGNFEGAGGAGATHIAAWDGTTWSVQNVGVDNTVYAMSVHNDGTGGALYVAGAFVQAPPVVGNRIARWQATGWSKLGAAAHGFNNFVYALTLFDDGSGGGPVLYAAGKFTAAGETPLNHIARWSGSGWTDVGGGTNSDVYALAVFDDGSGPALFAGGFFNSAGGVPVGQVARWNGTSWSALGSGAWQTGPGNNNSVHALAVFDDGSGGGPALFAGGFFLSAAGVQANRIAKWNGSTWSGLGGGLGDSLDFGGVFALQSFDDGSGPRLWGGGSFINGGNGYHIAAWNGTSWSTGIGFPNDAVHTFAVYDDGQGSGPALYTGGSFTSFGFGGPVINRVAKWDGASWLPLGTGLKDTDSSYSPFADALSVFDDGTGIGPSLFAGGLFLKAGGQRVHHVARWNGTSWSDVGGGVGGFSGSSVADFAVFDDGSGGGPALFTAGYFTTAGGRVSIHIGKWASVCPSVSFCAGDGSGTVCPCANSGALGHGCANSFNSAGALLSVTGNASVGADTLRLVGAGTSNSIVTYLQGTAQENGGAGSLWGDGLLCVAGSLIRLGSVQAAAGASQYPGPTNATISVRGQLPPGGAVTRTYQLWYRNAANYCTVSTFNVTNGILTHWVP